MSAKEEHLATRRAAGLFDFSFMALYEFSSQSSLAKLQTRDLDALAPGQIAYTLLLNPDGSVLIDATVWRLDKERFWLFTGKRIDVQARERSGEYAILALQGPASGRVLARLIGRDAVLRLHYFHFTQEGSLIIARLGYSGELGYELLVPLAQGVALRQRLLDAGSGEGLRACSFDAANSLRIECGYVLFDREIDGRANPRELGLERLVSAPRPFALSRRLVGLEIQDDVPQHGLPLAAVTSECWSPTFGKPIALGFTAVDVGRGESLRLEDGRAARVAQLPFYDPERRLPRRAAI